MSSPAARRPHATVVDAIRIAEAMNIDPKPWLNIHPTTYETFRFWQGCLFAPWQPRRIATLDANSTVLSTVPTAASAAGSDEAANECGICTEELVGKEPGSPTAIRLVDCRHAVHKKCMEGWLEVGSQTCPFCRKPLSNTIAEGVGPHFERDTNEYWLEDLIEWLPLYRGVDDGEVETEGWW